MASVEKESQQVKEQKELEVFAKYAKGRKFLIADSSASFRSGMAKVLSELGVQSTGILLASTFHDAKEMAEKHKPDILMADYDLGNSQGLELLQSQRANNPNSKKTVFILLTANGSQAAVAQAAEEDVDAFLLKPFTPLMMRRRILEAAIVKIQPTPYLLQILSGQEKLAAGDLAGAEEQFKGCLQLDPKPSLACFYLGQMHFKRQDYAQAEKLYKEGLTHSKIHYKCLIGIFELYAEQKNHSSAYDCIKRISQYYPLSSKRLSDALRLTIVSGRYEDIERYYALYCKIERREELLINYMCAALTVCGKYYLKTNNRARAVELLQTAAITSGSRTKFLKEIVQALIEHRFGNDASNILKRFPATTKTTAEYLLLEFQLSNLSSDALTIASKGRDLISKGIHSSRLYEIMITRSLEANSGGIAKTMLHEGSSKYPDQAKVLETVYREAQSNFAGPASQKDGEQAA